MASSPCGSWLPSVSAHLGSAAGSATGACVASTGASARLVIELQSYEHHAHRDDFDRDYYKPARLRPAGYEVLALTYRQVRDEPGWVAGAVRAMLDRAMGTGLARGAVIGPNV